MQPALATLYEVCGHVSIDNVPTMESQADLFLWEVGNVSRHGSSDDQASSSTLTEVQTDSPCAVECSGKISLNDLVPSLNSAVQDTRVGGTSSVGNEDIDLAKVLDDIGNELLNLSVVANVALVWLRFDAVLLLKLFRVLLSSLFAGRVCDGNISTHLSTSSSSFGANAGWTGSSSDDDDLSLQGQELLERVGLWDWNRHCENWRSVI